jgi:zinc protease
MNYASLIKQKRLPWGGVVLAADFPAYGSVSIVGSINGGERLAGEILLADIHAEMLLEGTNKRSKKDIQILLDDIGATLEFTVMGDRLMFTGRVREKFLDKLLGLVAEVLQMPLFPDMELVALKNRTLAELDLEAQNTRSQADIHLSRTLFTREHPNWKNTTSEEREMLPKVTRQSLHAYHKRAVDMSSLVLSVVGDTKPTNVFALTDKYFKRLPHLAIELPSYVAAHPQESKRVVTSIKEKASIDYMLGSVAGITKDHPDYPALLLGANILGNPRGFSGRLMKIVREKEGLTYGVYSYLNGFMQKCDGMMVVWGTFAPQLFAKGRSAIKREVERIFKKGVTPLEAKKHREMYAAGFKVQLSNSGAIAQAAHNTIVDGNPISYLDQWPKKILKVTPQQVNKVLKKYLSLDTLSESAAGPVEKNALTA